MASGPTFATRTPLHIGAVGLTVRDLDAMVTFYHYVLGLVVIERTQTRAVLGVADAPLLVLEHAPDAKPDDPRSAGLFHTAFLMPTREDLARWFVHVANNRVPLTGASDHLVSEAIYLDDPEGNGIEVYRDREPDEWTWKNDSVQMATIRLDLDGLAAVAGNHPAYAGAPAGLRIGHIHLRVGDVETAERFYHGALGFDVTTHYPGASFMSSGRYHHHVGANIWHSRGAGPRDPARAGLAWFAVEAADGLEAVKARLAEAGVATSPGKDGFAVADPWGTRVRLMAANVG